MANNLLADESTILDRLPDLDLPWAILIAIAVILMIERVAPGLGKLWRAFVWLARHISPRRFTPSARAEDAERRRIANLLLQNLDLLEADLHWQRDAFTEVRATIEAVDTPQRRHGGLFGFGGLKVAHRARSLSAALTHEPNRFVLLQAAPGAGKSVAMRHYARSLLERAISGKRSAVPLAICVSLRDFDLSPTDVTAEGLESYIATQVNQGAAPRLREYFQNQFTADLAAGNIVLILDSFDEIPAVLGSSNIDMAVRPYVAAITSLMGGSTSRCVVAAREYKGPRVPGWTRLEIVGLQFEEQCELLRSYGVSEAQLASAENLLRDPRAGFSTDLRNPLHLSLLADYLVANQRPPARPSELFEDYVDGRLAGASVDVDADDVRVLKEALQFFSFELTRSARTGLAAEENVLRAKIIESLPGDRVESVDRLLELVKLSKLLIEVRRGRRVAFVHRRVQEYFATQYVLAHPNTVGPGELTTSGRWRETAVALLQVGLDTQALRTEIKNTLRRELTRARGRPTSDFEWTPTGVHIMELLVAAYGSDPDRMPAAIRRPLSELVGRAWDGGGIGDRKFAIDCLPVTSAEIQQKQVEEAFTGTSHWLRRSALRDCSSLNPLPESIDRAIRRLLVTLISGRQLVHDAAALNSDLGRLYQKRELVKARKVLAAAPRIVVTMALVTALAELVLRTMANPTNEPPAVSLAIAALLWFVPPIIFFWSTQADSKLSYPRASRMRRLFLVQEVSLGIAALLAVLCGLFLLIQLITSIALIVTGNWAYGLLGAIVAPLVTIYVYAWGPLLLLSFVNRWFPGGLRFRELAFPAAERLPVLRARLRQFSSSIVERCRKLTFRKAIRAMGGLLLAGASLAAMGAIFVLVLYFLKLLISWLGVGSLIPMLFGIGMAGYFGYVLVTPIVSMLRELRSWYRARHVQARRAGRVEPQAVVDDLCVLADPISVAEYLLHLRTQRTDQARRLPRVFVRQMSDLIQAESGSRPRPATLERAIAAAVKDGRLQPAMLRSWSDGVLDEFGQLDEFLRER